MNAGSRVQVNELCPWPERVGCEGVVVSAREARYPAWPRLRPDQIIVRLDDDPLRYRPDDEGRWTCVVDAASVTVVSSTQSQPGEDT